jgi:SAM-dependent methyltransferase
VLEHLPHPAAALAAAAENLRDGGILALAVPNPHALQFRLLRGHWAHVDAPRHLFLIPLRAVVAQLQARGLELVASTCADPAGRHWNRFGWEYALRIHPARRSGGRLTRLGSGALARLVAPLERSDLRGATYSAVFVKRG